MTTPENLIGQKIKNFRQDRKLSVQQLAELSGSSVELIESIENGKLLPSLTPLMKIARALGVRLGTFLDDQLQTAPALVRAGKPETVVRFSGKNTKSQDSALDFFPLASHKKDRHMEPFLIDVHPAKQNDQPLSSHEGEEFIYVLKGKIEIFYGKEKYLLNTGDSIYYDSIVPHDLHAAQNQDAKILAVVYAPF